MVRGLIVAALLAGAVLSGCLADDSGSAVGSNDGGTAGPDAGQGNQTFPADNGTAAPAAPNTPPTANVTANVTAGTAPLVVSFELSGEDADGDNLTWTFDADGDGTPEAEGSDLPASFEATYEEAGNYTAVLSVSDGNATVTSNVTIVVELPVLDGPNICDRPNATSYGGTLYSLSEGGTWIFRESNGIPGLQVGNTHPTGPNGGGVGFANPAWADCVMADQMLV